MLLLLLFFFFWQVFLDFISYSGGPLPEDLLKIIKVPVVIAWGDQDPWEPIEQGRAFAGFDSVEVHLVNNRARPRCVCIVRLDQRFLGLLLLGGDNRRTVRRDLLLPVACGSLCHPRQLSRAFC